MSPTVFFVGALSDLAYPLLAAIMAAHLIAMAWDVFGA